MKHEAHQTVPMTLSFYTSHNSLNHETLYVALLTIAATYRLDSWTDEDSSRGSCSTYIGTSSVRSQLTKTVTEHNTFSQTGLSALQQW